MDTNELAFDQWYKDRNGVTPDADKISPWFVDEVIEAYARDKVMEVTGEYEDLLRLCADTVADLHNSLSPYA